MSLVDDIKREIHVNVDAYKQNNHDINERNKMLLQLAKILEKYNCIYYCGNSILVILFFLPAVSDEKEQIFEIPILSMFDCQNNNKVITD